MAVAWTPGSAGGGSHCHKPRRMGNIMMNDSSSEMNRSEVLKVGIYQMNGRCPIKI